MKPHPPHAVKMGTLFHFAFVSDQVDKQLVSNVSSESDDEQPPRQRKYRDILERNGRTASHG